jgi:hypothetical protein
VQLCRHPDLSADSTDSVEKDEPLSETEAGAEKAQDRGEGESLACMCLTHENAVLIKKIRLGRTMTRMVLLAMIRPIQRLFRTWIVPPIDQTMPGKSHHEMTLRVSRVTMISKVSCRDAA